MARLLEEASSEIITEKPDTDTTENTLYIKLSLK
jgi:hypothetical protein